MSILQLVDMAIDEDPGAPCLWIPAEHWSAFCAELGRGPNRIGVVVYRRKTIREGEPYGEITTRRPD